MTFEAPLDPRRDESICPRPRVLRPHAATSSQVTPFGHGKTPTTTKKEIAVKKRTAIQALLAPTALAGVAAAAALTAGAASAGAVANISVHDGMITSDKGISNIVVMDCNGDTVKTEFKGNMTSLKLEDGAATVWVKSGNNKSGDGPGYGERFELQNCASGLHR